MIVIDTSALAAFLLREKDWRKLAKYMKRVVSVDYIMVEFYNVIWKAIYIHKLLKENEALKIIELLKEYAKANMKLEDTKNYLDKALKVALRTGLTIYDSLYITLALEKRLPLLTLDKRQKEEAKKLNIEVVEL